MNSDAVFASARAALEPKDDQHPVALMTCGLAGTGKTTLAKNVLAHLPGFIRLSNDEIIAEKHGLYGKDYAASETLYKSYMEEADSEFLARLRARLRAGKNVIVDRSLYAREDRDAIKKMITDGGAQWVLIYFHVSASSKEALWERICARSAKKRDANSALEISRDILEQYWMGFEEPIDEGAIVLNVL